MTQAQRIEHLQQGQADLNKKIDRVLSLLENDDKVGKKGLVQQALDNRTDIDKMQLDEKIKKGQMAVLAALGGAAASIAWWVVEHFIYT